MSPEDTARMWVHCDHDPDSARLCRDCLENLKASARADGRLEGIGEMQLRPPKPPPAKEGESPFSPVALFLFILGIAVGAGVAGALFYNGVVPIGVAP